MSDQERIKELEAKFADVEVSSSLTSGVDERRESQAGDVALQYLDKAFSVVEEYLSLKLGSSLLKPLVLTQVKFAFMLLRTVVAQALD